MGRREYKGAARKAKLSTSLGGTSSDLTINCDDLTGWPTGVDGRLFYVVIGRDTTIEEKILCSSRSGNTLTVWSDGLSNGRGGDDTSIAAHAANDEVEHVFTAVDADEANSHVNSPTLHVTGGGTDHVFWQNGQTVTADYTITAAMNAGSWGPITVDSGVTVTVPSGSTWTVI